MRNPRAAKIAATKARTEALRARASQQVPQQAAGEEAVAPPPAAHFYLKPQLTGPVELRVGSATFSIPEGSRSRVTLGTHGHAIAAVETPDGTLAFFDEERGQASMHEALKGPVRALLLSSASASKPTSKMPPASQVIEPPSIRGTGIFLSLGLASWSLDTGTRIAHIPKRNAAFVLSKDGTLHYLMARGQRVVEVKVPANVAAQAMRRYFPETHRSSPGAFASLPPGPSMK